jgi:TonB family protein
VGPSDEVAKPSFAGKISGELEGRAVVSWPNPPTGYSGTGGGKAIVKFWVDPAGSVIRVEINKKSGSPKLDSMAMEYVKQIRFVALPENVQHRTQWGEIPIEFELTRSSG